MIEKLKNKLSQDIHLAELLKGSSIAFTFKIVGIGFGYIFTILIAKWYGVQTLGLFALSMTILNIFVTFSLFGFNNALSKFIAQFNHDFKQSLVKEVYFKALKITIPLGILLSFILYTSANFLAINIFDNKDSIPFFKIVSIAIVPSILLSINATVFRGLKNITLFSFFQSLGIYFLAVILLMLFYMNNSYKIDAILSQTLAISIMCIVSIVYIYKHTYIYKVSIKNSLKYKKIMSVAFPMLLTSSMGLIIASTDIVMIGIFRSEEEVGIYSVIVKIATITTFALMAINSISGPKYSELSENKLELKKVINKSSKILFLFGTIIILILFLFSKTLLGFFGKEFLVGLFALHCLLFGYYFRIISGSIGEIFQNTGHERLQSKLVFLFAVLNIFLNFILIPKYGINGAAIATMLTLILGRIISLFYFYQNFKFIPLLTFNFIRNSK